MGLLVLSVLEHYPPNKPFFYLLLSNVLQGYFMRAFYLVDTCSASVVVVVIHHLSLVALILLKIQEYRVTPNYKFKDTIRVYLKNA